MPALTPEELDFLRQHQVEAVCLSKAHNDSELVKILRSSTPFATKGRIQIVLTPEKLHKSFRNLYVTLIEPADVDTLISLCSLPIKELMIRLSLTELPTMINQFVHLIVLNSGHNQLTSLPKELWQITNLDTLDISHNQLTTLPSEISQLTQLCTLNAWDNQLTALPLELSKLTQLTRLDIGQNQISEIPMELCQLAQLQRLYVYNNELTILPIELGQLIQLTRLDISGNKLTTLPITLGNLTQLTMLNTGRNQLITLPATLGLLMQLIKLDISGNMLTKLPSELGLLTQLQELYVYQNKLTTLPAMFSQLNQLTVLDISFNHLVALPTEIKYLIQLTTLNVRSNELTLLPIEIGYLTQLTTLNVWDNQLVELPTTLGHLTQLQVIYAYNNKLSVLPREIGQLTQLTTLDIGHNLITTLPDELCQLSQLKKLYAQSNKLTTLPLALGQLDHLTKLDVSRNPLITLPPTIRQLTKLQHLDLQYTAISIPTEILAKTDDPAIVLDYYFEVGRPINQVKVLVVGQGSVGKTSLIERLVRGTFTSGQTKTEGIAVSAWEVVDTKTPAPIRLNIWDFGGQEIMHATHQFFLTKRSLYLLVVNARQTQEENRVEDWLKIIQSFGGDSPVLLVGNKTDEHPLDIDRTGLQKKYPNLVGFVETSATTGKGVDALREEIAAQVNVLPHVRDLFPEKWWTVKTKLETWEKGGRNYLTREGYVALCDTEGIPEAVKQRTLIGFLHDLGNVLYFQDEERLAALGILRPQWVTDGVYKILNNRAVFDNKGVLTLEALHSVLDLPDYPRDKHLFIVDMMRKFELCYDLIPDKEFLIPDLLPKDEPYTGEWAGALGFEYHYNVLPSSVISRFIVRMHPHIHARPTLWRAGVVVQLGANTALVKADTEERRISLRVGGPAPTRREALGAIRAQLTAIHKTIIKLEATAQVAHPEYPALLIDYEKLLQFERDDVMEFPESVGGRTIMVNVRELLDGVANPSERQRPYGDERTEMEVLVPKPAAPAPVVPAQIAPAPPQNFRGRMGLALKRVLAWPSHLGRLAFDLLKYDKASDSSTLILGYVLFGLLLALLVGLVNYLDLVRVLMGVWKFFVP